MAINDVFLKDSNLSQIRINPSRTIFWTGAGISCIAPSNLPLGKKLTDAYLSSCLGPKWKEFVALWNNYFPQIKASVKDGGWHRPEPIGHYTCDDVNSDDYLERPRLEYIIGEIDKLDKYFNGISFNNPGNNRIFHRGSSIAALSHFSDVEPCSYHYHLADLSREGAVMVTANFDDGIEKALGVDSSKVEKVYNTEAVDNGYGGYVFHFHGIATDDTDKLGATVKTISKGLASEFQDYLKSCFEDGFDIVFIGYGGEDFFDVQPFFKSLEVDKYEGKAIYLQYCRDDSEVETLKQKGRNYDYLLEPFKDKFIVYGDTEEFFRSIYDSYTPVRPMTADCGAFKATMDALNKIAEDQPDKKIYYFLNMFRICSQLNINPGRFYPDWIDRIKELFNMWEEDGSLEKMTVVNGQKNDGIIDDIFSNNWHDIELTKTGMGRKLRPYLNHWNKKHHNTMMIANGLFGGHGCWLPRKVIIQYVDETERILENRLTDECSNDISRATVMYLCGTQTKLTIGLYKYTGGLLKGRMLFLKECIERLRKYHFTRFVYRTHYLSLCRQSGYIDSALHKGKNGYEGDIQHEWDICMQTPILYDAGQVLYARLIQAKQYGFSEGVDELREIRERILDLRKAESKWSYKLN